MIRVFSLVALLFFQCVALDISAQDIDIPGPPGSTRFGAQTAVLPNGNIVVTDPYFDTNVIDAGAVYLYNGATGELISEMYGSRPNDRIGNGRITILTDGDFLISSPNYTDGAAPNAGALTRCSRNTGCPEFVSAASSLVGTQPNDGDGSYVVVLANGNYLQVSPYWHEQDYGSITFCDKTNGCPVAWVTQSRAMVGSRTGDRIGIGGVTPLPNGNYVVKSPLWNRGGFAEAGAVTFVNGNTGMIGQIQDTNSLVGTSSLDHIGSGGIFPLPNGKYVISSPGYTSNFGFQVGAVTLASGTAPITGFINPSNSLMGSRTGDEIGKEIAVLSNGNYVVSSPGWDNGTAAADVGAVTWVSGTAGLTGNVSAANSITGQTAGDRIGSKSVTPLSNGDYAIISPEWKNNAGNLAGAVTWATGTGPTSINVTAANSIVGLPGDNIGSNGVIALKNGNYVVCSPLWDGHKGAATWAAGGGVVSIVVSAANSLVGSASGDAVCENGVLALPGGNYTVASNNWSNGSIAKAGGVTWGSGTAGVSGPISSANSLVGTNVDDQAGSGGVKILTNGNYIVSSPNADNGGAQDAGAVTWANASTGAAGNISAANSLIGTLSGDKVGIAGVLLLPNGNYVVSSPSWQGNTGASTWVNGSIGLSGPITAGNSLVGSIAGDSVSDGGTVAVTNGTYVVRSSRWSDSLISGAGAVTWGKSSVGLRGLITAKNSVIGAVPNGGVGMNFAVDGVSALLAVGRPSENMLSIRSIAITGSISGTVIDANGLPVRNATVSVTAPNGERTSVQTGSFGTFLFENLQTGRSYIVAASAKRYRFDNPSPILLESDLTGVTISARSPE